MLKLFAVALAEMLAVAGFSADRSGSAGQVSNAALETRRETAGAQFKLSSISYRLPFANGTRIEVFDDFLSHRPIGRIDFYAIGGTPPYQVVAAAAGRVVAIQDGYSERQSGRAAKDCHNNYIWIKHPNGEWSNYSHIAKGSATGAAGLKIGEQVRAGQFIGIEGEVGCAMLRHVHFEVARPARPEAIDTGGFLNDNDNGKRELKPRFCGLPQYDVTKGAHYLARPC